MKSNSGVPEVCQNCWYYSRKGLFRGEKFGYCTYNPPVVFEGKTVRPTVMEDESCSEYVLWLDAL